MDKTERFKELQAEINGKRVVWNGEAEWCKGFKFDAICLWEPGANDVSIKPYGYTVDELYDKARSLMPSEDMYAVRKNDFCFALLNSSILESMERLAKLPEGNDFIHKKIVDKEDCINSLIGGAPSCPY